MNDTDRSIAAFTMLAHGIFHTYEMSIPLFIIIWLETFDVSAAVLGVIVTAGIGLIGVGAPITGVLSDAYGSRQLITASIIGMGGGFFLLALTPNVYVVGIALVIWGATASFYHPAGLSMISRESTSRGTVFAYHGAAGNVGTALGPLCTAVLLLAFDWRLVIGVLTLPAIAAVLYGSTIEFEETTQVAPEPDGGKRTALDLESFIAASRSLFTTGFSLAFGIIVLFGVYYRGLLTFLPDVLGDLSLFEPIVLFGYTEDPAQYIYAGLLLIGVLGQYVGGKVTERIASEVAFSAVLAVLAVLSVLFLPAVELGVLPFLVVCAALGFCLYAAVPIYQVVIADRSADDAHGLSYGFAYLGSYGFGAVGATLAGSLLTYTTQTTLLATLAGIALVAASLVVVLMRIPRLDDDTAST